MSRKEKSLEEIEAAIEELMMGFEDMTSKEIEGYRAELNGTLPGIGKATKALLDFMIGFALARAYIREEKP